MLIEKYKMFNPRLILCQFCQNLLKSQIKKWYTLLIYCGCNFAFGPSQNHWNWSVFCRNSQILKKKKAFCGIFRWKLKNLNRNKATIKMAQQSSFSIYCFIKSKILFKSYKHLFKSSICDKSNFIISVQVKS